MKRIEKTGEFIVKAITLPLRIGVGIWRCIDKATPSNLEDCMPFEIKRKEENDRQESRDDSRTV